MSDDPDARLREQLRLGSIQQAESERLERQREERLEADTTELLALAVTTALEVLQVADWPDPESVTVVEFKYRRSLLRPNPPRFEQVRAGWKIAEGDYRVVYESGEVMSVEPYAYFLLADGLILCEDVRQWGRWRNAGLRINPLGADVRISNAFYLAKRDDSLYDGGQILICHQLTQGLINLIERYGRIPPVLEDKIYDYIDKYPPP